MRQLPGNLDGAREKKKKKKETSTHGEGLEEGYACTKESSRRHAVGFHIPHVAGRSPAPAPYQLHQCAPASCPPPTSGWASGSQESLQVSQGPYRHMTVITLLPDFPPVFHIKLKDQVLLEGEAATLLCLPAACPAPRISWMKGKATGQQTQTQGMGRAAGMEGQ